MTYYKVNKYKCQGYGPAGIAPHWVKRIDAAGWCRRCHAECNSRRPKKVIKSFNDIRNGPTYKEQWAFRVLHGGAFEEAKKAWLKKTGRPWLTVKAIKERTGTARPTTRRVHVPTFKEYVRGKSTGRTGGERAIAKNREAQRKLESWVKNTGIKKLGFDSRYKVKDHTRSGGFDFALELDGELKARVDAKSQFTTTKAQDVQLEQAWKSNVPCFLVNYTRYKQLTPDTKRRPNGSIWG